MSNYIKVKNHSGLVRDPISGAIINVDADSYTKYKNKKAANKKRFDKEVAQETRLNMLEKKIQSMENSLNKILDILTHGNS